MISYLPVNYYTYNSHNYFLATTISVLFTAFFIILYTAFLYETTNRANVCSPMFYYGGACKRQIARTALLNPEFSKIKNDYYANINTRIQPKIEHADSSNNIVNEDVNDYLSKNKEFNEETVQEIQDMTNILNLITTKYLGNIQQFLATSSQETSTSVALALQDIPYMIQTVKDKLNQAIVEPTSAIFIAPLQKLYKALSNVETSANTQNTN